MYATKEGNTLKEQGRGVCMYTLNSAPGIENEIENKYTTIPYLWVS